MHSKCKINVYFYLTDMLVIKTDRASCIGMYNLCSVLMMRMKMEVKVLLFNRIVMVNIKMH